MVLPIKPQVELPDSASRLGYPQQLGKQVAQQLNLKYLDPLPFFRSRKDAQDFFYDQCHYTVTGNQALSEFLKPHIEAWLDSKNSSARIH